MAASTSSSENWRVGWSISTGGSGAGAGGASAADCGIAVVDRGLEALLGDHLVEVAAVVEVQIVVLGRLGGHGLVDHGGCRVATGGAQRLVLEARHLTGVGTVAPLELEMFLDRVVEQSHCAPNPSDAGRELQLG